MAKNEAMEQKLQTRGDFGCIRIKHLGFSGFGGYGLEPHGNEGVDKYMETTRIDQTKIK